MQLTINKRLRNEAGHRGMGHGGNGDKICNSGGTGIKLGMIEKLGGGLKKETP
jgi:hypothetical protein